MRADTIARATELLDLIKAPTSVATVILLAFVTSQLRRNADELDLPRTWFALFAALGADMITAAVVAVMLPLTIRVTITNFGGEVDTLLLVYVLTHLVAFGTALYAIKCTWDCAGELAAASHRTSG